MLSQLSPAERVERVLALRWRKPSKARVCGSSAVRGSEERGGRRHVAVTSPLLRNITINASVTVHGLCWYSVLQE